MKISYVTRGIVLVNRKAFLRTNLDQVAQRPPDECVGLISSTEKSKLPKSRVKGGTKLDHSRVGSEAGRNLLAAEQGVAPLHKQHQQVHRGARQAQAYLSAP